MKDRHVFSQLVSRDLYFVKDDFTKQKLVSTGIESGDIYTRDELAILLRAHKQAPFSTAELKKIDEMKRLFNARITEILESPRPILMMQPELCGASDDNAAW